MKAELRQVSYNDEAEPDEREIVKPGPLDLREVILNATG